MRYACYCLMVPVLMMTSLLSEAKPPTNQPTPRGQAVRARFVHNPDPMALSDTGFKDIQAYINTEKGCVTIMLRYEEPTIPLVMPLANRLAIGLYDSNGQMLKMFVTKEWFYDDITDDGSHGAAKELGGMHIPTNRMFTLQYAVNMRDAPYVKEVHVALGPTPE